MKHPPEHPIGNTYFHKIPLVAAVRKAFVWFIPPILSLSSSFFLLQLFNLFPAHQCRVCNALFLQCRTFIVLVDLSCGSTKAWTGQLDSFLFVHLEHIQIESAEFSHLIWQVSRLCHIPLTYCPCPILKHLMSFCTYFKETLRKSSLDLSNI